MHKEPKWIKSLELIRGLAILGVLIGHTTTAVIYSLDPSNLLAIYSLHAINKVTLASVPLFLMISGYLFQLKTPSFMKLANRLLGIWLPYLIVVFSLFLFRAYIDKELFFINDTFIKIISGSTGQYYFIPLITSCYLIGKILLKLKADKIKFFATFMLLMSLIISLDTHLNFIPEFIPSSLEGSFRLFMLPVFSKVFLEFAGYFFIGMFISQYSKPIRRFARDSKYLLATITILLLFISMAELVIHHINQLGIGSPHIIHKHISTVIYSISLFVLILGIQIKQIPQSISFLSKYSFLIYIFHDIVFITDIPDYVSSTYNPIIATIILLTITSITGITLAILYTYGYRWFVRMVSGLRLS